MDIGQLCGILDLRLCGQFESVGDVLTDGQVEQDWLLAD
jgi:hypothetical protein